METEIWKDIPGYEGHYQISSHGCLKSLDRIVHSPLRQGDYLRRGKIFNVIRNKKYYRSTLCINAIERKFYIHKLVAMAFFPNPENKREVNHIDGNTSNNKISNLEWCTPSENTQHALRTGLKVPIRGLQHYKCKKVQNIETGKIYGSLSEAALASGLSSGALCQRLKRGYKKEPRFKYI